MDECTLVRELDIILDYLENNPTVYDDLTTFAQSPVNSPERFERTNQDPKPPTDARACTSIDTEMEVTAECVDGGFETITKTAKRKAKVVKKTASSKKPNKSATINAPAARVSSGDTVFPLPAVKSNVAPQALARAPSSTALQSPASEPSPTALQVPATAIPPRVRPPPPVIIQEKSKWIKVSDWMLAQKVKFTSAQSTQEGIKVQCAVISDHHRLTSHLRETNVGFYTYALKDALHVVIKGLPKEFETSFILEGIKSQGYPVREVHHMYHFETKKMYDSFHVILDLSPEGKQIFNVQSICSLTGILVEPLRNRGLKEQCHRCQIYGHSAQNCNAHPNYTWTSASPSAPQVYIPAPTPTTKACVKSTPKLNPSPVTALCVPTQRRRDALFQEYMEAVNADEIINPQARRQAVLDHIKLIAAFGYFKMGLSRKPWNQHDD